MRFGTPLVVLLLIISMSEYCYGKTRPMKFGFGIRYGFNGYNSEFAEGSTNFVESDPKMLIGKQI